MFADVYSHDHSFIVVVSRFKCAILCPIPYASIGFRDEGKRKDWRRELCLLHEKGSAITVWGESCWTWGCVPN